MAILTQTLSLIHSLCRCARSLPVFLALILSMPAWAESIISYQMTGIMDDEFLYTLPSGESVTGNEYVEMDPGAPTILNSPFSLSFDLEDSVSRAPDPSSDSSTYLAISNLMLTIGGAEMWSSNIDPLSEFATPGNGNHQWSISSIFDHALVEPTIVPVDVWSGGSTDLLLENLTLASLGLFLLDGSESLFNASPPELVVIDGTEFTYMDLELRWEGNGLSGTYGYILGGAITDVTVSAVPLPGAIWLFGSALLGLAGFSKYRKT